MDKKHGHKAGYEHAAGHDHGTDSLSGRRVLGATLLNAVITVVEIGGGILSGSLALLSDAAHNFSDTAAIALSYVTNRIAQRPKDARKTFGYKRAEILAAFVNSAVLLTISIVLIFEAVLRWRSPTHINGALMIAVAAVGLVANLVTVLLLQRDAHKSLNIRSSYLHLLSDAFASVGVLVGGIVIELWGTVWVDPLITVLITLYIIRETWKVLRKTVDILMQSSAELDFAAIQKDIEENTEVLDIHHVHCWMIDEKTVFFEAHIDLEDMPLSEAEKVYDRIERLLQERHGISHVTLQAEVENCPDKSVF